MKRIFLSVALLSLIVVTSCKEKETVSTSETETIIEEAPATQTEAQSDTISVTTEEADGTSVKMNGDGVSVDTKDGSNKTNVEVNGGGAAVEVKK